MEHGRIHLLEKDGGGHSAGIKRLKKALKAAKATRARFGSALEPLVAQDMEEIVQDARITIIEALLVEAILKWTKFEKADDAFMKNEARGAVVQQFREMDKHSLDCKKVYDKLWSMALDISRG